MAGGFRFGAYVGNGTAGRQIDTTFLPSGVIVWRGATSAMYRLDVMGGGDVTGQFNNGFAPPLTQRITAFNATGFTVGSHVDVNNTGDEYYWMAWQNGAGLAATGTYTGTFAVCDGSQGGTSQSISIGFRPAYFHTLNTGGSYGLHRTESVPTSHARSLIDVSLDVAANCTFTATGVDVAGQGNFTCAQYHWFAFAPSVDCVRVTYTGNGATPRDITGAGFAPDLALVFPCTDSPSTNTRYVGYRTRATPSANQPRWLHGSNDAGNPQDMIALLSDGVRIGSHQDVNESGKTFDTLFFRTSLGPIPGATGLVVAPTTCGEAFSVNPCPQGC